MTEERMRDLHESHTKLRGTPEERKTHNEVISDFLAHRKKKATTKVPISQET